MAKCIDVIGQTYGRLTVMESLGVFSRKQIVLTQCSCGNQFTAPISNIRSGNTLSCGCLRKEKTSERARKHGIRHTRLYRVYTAMIQRCLNPNDRSYPNYGQRGISVCQEWGNDINTFIEWAQSSGYKDDLEIERTDVNLGYSPENCRWATSITQSRNRRTRKHSSSYTGVHQRSSSGKWIASITVNKTKTSLGSFDSEAAAWKARCDFIDHHRLKHFQTNR